MSLGFLDAIAAGKVVGIYIARLIIVPLYIKMLSLRLHWKQLRGN
jgi:hypothetical protein